MTVCSRHDFICADFRHITTINLVQQRASFIRLQPGGTIKSHLIFHANPEHILEKVPHRTFRVLLQLTCAKRPFVSAFPIISPFIPPYISVMLRHLRAATRFECKSALTKRRIDRFDEGLPVLHKVYIRTDLSEDVMRAV
ncbi:hypothetical protein D3C74_390010 [compost metagenome]